MGDPAGGHEIKIEPETIQKPADIISEEVCAPLDEGVELLEGALASSIVWAIAVNL